MKTTYREPIGILGGTFDPIHAGHLEIAKRALNACELKEVRFVPSYIPVHRATPNVSPEDRLAMLQLALENHPNFFIDDCELQRHGPSYMIDTLRCLQGGIPITPLCLILGQDAFLYLHHWLQWRDIIKTANIIVVSRQTYASGIPDELTALLKKHETKNIQDLHTHLSGKIFQLKTEPIDASASHIRYQLQQNERPEQLPDKVYQYILDNKLYQEPSHFP